MAIKFGGSQRPASIHNQSARRFGSLLEQKLGDRIAFELVGSVLDLGRTSAEHAAFVEAVQPVLARYRKQLDPALFASLEV